MEEFQVHYFNPHILLVVNTQGIIRQLHTPVKVQCVQDTGIFKKGVFTYIDLIGMEDSSVLVYFINGKAYSHNYFRIIANF